MIELMEQFIEKNIVNELDVKKTTQIALATAAISVTALGIGNKMAPRPSEPPVKTNIKAEELPLHKEAEKSLGVEAISIDMKRIEDIESGGNPRAFNKRSGARGLLQIRLSTWEEMVKKMGSDWDWYDAFDPDKNKAVGTYYMNVRIPEMLRAFNIEDTLENRLAAYNWGIGGLLHNTWQDAPQETLDYIKKYKR